LTPATAARWRGAAHVALSHRGRHQPRRGYSPRYEGMGLPVERRGRG